MAKKYHDTKEQSTAQAFDRHISVTANAGSGKTTILKKRFIKIALSHKNNFDARRVVAITFTKKAAGEIFTKIADELDEMIDESIDSYELHRQLQQIRTDLKSANISTIHSFCSSLIRDFPIEAGVAPNFTELTETDRKKMTGEAIREVLSNHLGRHDNDLKEAILGYTKTQIESAITDLLYKSDKLVDIQKVYQKSDEDIIIAVQEEIFSASFPHVLNNINRVKEILLELSTINDKRKNDVLDKIQLLESILKEIPQKEGISVNTFKALANKLDSFRRVLKNEKILKADDTPHGTPFKAAKIFKYNEVCATLKTFFGNIETIFSIYNTDSISSSIAHQRTILSIAIEVKELIEHEKSVNNQLDFDDLLLRTRTMLQDEELAEKVRKRIDYLMIDEFQDTNDVQYDIVKSLVPDLVDDTKSPSINLFIVGDPKQSIYGFRNADVRVFNKATKDIYHTNSQFIDKELISDKVFDYKNQVLSESDDELRGKMNLSVSFRHYPVIAAFTNCVCRKLMNKKESEYDVDYNNLVCFQVIDELHESKDLKQLTDNFGSVSILFDKPEEGKTDYQTSEYTKLAAVIQSIVNGNFYSKQYDYRDIILLGRTRTKFSKLTKEFQNSNIPYITHSGKGFYQSQEIIDIMSILQFLYNNNDDLSLLALLRSPLFGVSDDVLMQINSDKSSDSLWEKLKKFSNTSTSESTIRAVDVLNQLNSYIHVITLPQLIRKIVELTCFDGVIEKYSGSIQIKANINKFLDISRAFVKRGFKNMFDFIEEIEYIHNEEVQEDEAAILTNDNAVNIMTVHAAKGLENKIVILFDSLNKPPNNKNKYLNNDKYGLILKSPSDINRNILDCEDNFFYKFIKEQQKNSEEAEAKRLLYVALTRAKEHLIISGSCPKGTSHNNFLGKIINSFGLVFGDYKENPENIYCSEELNTYKEGTHESISLGFEIKLIDELIETESSKLATNIDLDSYKIHLEEILAEKVDERISATKLMTIENSSENFISKYILDLERNYEENSRFDFASNISGAQIGTAIHYLLENMDSYLLSENQIGKEEFNKIYKKALIISKIQNDDMLKQYITSTIHNVFSSNLLMRNQNLLKSSEKELKLHIPFENDFIDVIIDFVLKESGSVVEIWDWKSNKVSSVEDMIETAKHYKTQMFLYAYVLSFYAPYLSSIKTKLLFTKLAVANAKDEEWTVTFDWDRSKLNSYAESIKVKIELVKDYS